MKKIIICTTCVVLGFALIGCVLSSSNLFKQPPTKYVEVLFDDTDLLSVKPTSQDVIALLNLTNENKYDGLDVRIRKLSSVNLTDIYEHTLPSEMPITGDEMRRVLAVKNFKSAVTNKIIALNKEKSEPQDYSVLYRTIAQELNHMVAVNVGKGGTKTCLIYSDMEEHSQDADFVSFWGYMEVIKNPLAVANKLEKVVPLSDLSGIRVKVIFKPRSHAQELKFNSYMAVFKIILQRHNATLTISANAMNQ